MSLTNEKDEIVGVLRMSRAAALCETKDYLAVLEAELDGLRADLLDEIRKLREAEGLPL